VPVGQHPVISLEIWPVTVEVGDRPPVNAGHSVRAMRMLLYWVEPNGARRPYEADLDCMAVPRTGREAAYSGKKHAAALMARRRN
jgi:hypothetical protein